MIHHWVCKICFLAHGLKGSEIKNWPVEGDMAGIVAHLRGVHGITVREYEDENGRIPSKSGER
jgi:hypothetical protein